MNSEPDNNLDMVVCTLFVVIVKFVNGDISISKVKKEKFSSDSYQDKAEFFLSICFCSSIAYARRLVSLVRSRIKRRSFLITTEDHVIQDRGLCPLLFVRDLREECV